MNFKKINLITGNKFISDQILADLQKLQINLIIQKYMSKEDIEKDDKLIAKLQDFKLNVGYILLTDYNNKDIINKFYEYILSKIKINFITHDFIISKDDYNLNLYKNDLNTLGNIKLDEFSMKKDYNSCLNGNITFLADGTIVPCLGLYKFTLGNINIFQDVFKKNNLEKFWNLSKSKIEGCSECSLRYACNDCRQVEIELGATLYKTVSCKRINENEV